MWKVLRSDGVETAAQMRRTTPRDDHNGARRGVCHNQHNSSVPELVVIADQLLAPVPGGTGRYTSELLRALARTTPPGWTVSSVVCRAPDISAAEIPGVNGPRVLPMPRKALQVAWRAGVGIWPGGDAVHAPTPFAPPRKPSPGTTLAVTVHDTVAWSHPDTLTKRGVAWHKAMIGKAMTAADVVVVPTRTVADDLSKLFPQAAAPIRVISHGTADVFTAAEGAKVRIDVGHLDLPPRYILAVGTLEPRKGLDVLIDAVARLHRSSSRAPDLLLVGQQGWGAVNPAALASQHGLRAGAVRVLGHLPDLELAAVMRRASVLAAPSKAEGFGLPVLEAMAAGVPVVHSDAPALVEVAGGAGVAVPRGDAAALANALRDVVADSLWSAQLANKGRKRAREFSWLTAAEEMWQLHQDGYEACSQRASANT